MQLNKKNQELPEFVLEPPRLLSSEGPLTGVFREIIEDFNVDEIPAYTPAGHGEHLFALIEKRDVNTADAVAQLARALGVNPRDAGWAGLKDRRAITRQWISLHNVEAERALALDLPNVRVLRAVRHPHKLRTGHLHGNRFVICVRHLVAGAEQVRHRLERLARGGVPNYFGAQRFGHGGRNVERAYQWLARGGPAPRKPFERKLYTSALQAALFNNYLARRMALVGVGGVLPGDVFQHEPAGALFFETDQERANERIAAFAISPTGPIYGERMHAASGDAAALERDVLEAAGLTFERVATWGKLAQGTRRVTRLRPTDTLVRQADSNAVWLEFTLPKGAYATTILREIFGSGLHEAGRSAAADEDPTLAEGR